MSEKKQSKPKLIEVKFDCEKLGISEDSQSVYGISVILVDGKLVGKADEISVAALQDAGKL